VQTLSYGFEQVGQKAEQMGFRSMRAFQGVIFGLQMSTFYASMFMSALMKDDNALLSLEGSTERYNKALREYGRNSEEARNAARSLEMAQNNLNRAQTMSTVLTGSIILQGVSLATSFIALAKSITTANTALQIHNFLKTYSLALTGVGIVAVGAAIAAAGAYGAMSANQPQININSNVSLMGEKDLDTALDRQNRNIRDEARRLGAYK